MAMRNQTRGNNAMMNKGSLVGQLGVHRKRAAVYYPPYVYSKQDLENLTVEERELYLAWKQAKQERSDANKERKRAAQHSGRDRDAG